MVVFICNDCGDSLRKHKVEEHAWRCRRTINVSCMDCLKDFPGKTYNEHTTCISEAKKYSGKDYVESPNANKGAKKQESWVATVRSITDSKKNLPKGVMNAFEVIQRQDNIPRKFKGFMNFFQNSAKHISKPDVEKTWALIQEQTESDKKSTQQPNKTDQTTSKLVDANATNGNTSVKRKSEDDAPKPLKEKKRKIKASDKNDHHDPEEALLEDQTNGTNGTHVESEETEQTKDVEKFRWNEAIRDLLVSKNNQMNLSKLKKTILKRYRKYTGTSSEEKQEIEAKFEKKFNKKIAKSEFVIENDTVRLVQ